VIQVINGVSLMLKKDWWRWLSLASCGLEGNLDAIGGAQGEEV
jgi:hypothetical protein